MKLVYVAGPYRAPTLEGIEANIRYAARYGAKVAAAGFAPLVPHTIGFACDEQAHMADTSRRSDDFWLMATAEMLLRCDAILVIPGWEQSSDTQAEIVLAGQQGIPVVYVADDGSFVDALNRQLATSWRRVSRDVFDRRVTST